MKKAVFLTAFVCLLAISALAQEKAVNFSGDWTLDVSKSKLDERMRVESMTMKVTQSDKELKVETAIKRAPRPEGSGGGMGRGGFGAGDSTLTYTLDGKETKIQQESPMGAIPVTLKATLESGGKLKLASSRTFSGQMGEVSITTDETWSLSDDGRTLTVKRDMKTPRGANSSEMVFTKK
jgi:hypothetical protein